MAATNTGNGRKAAKQLRFYMTYILPVSLLAIRVIGLVSVLAQKPAPILGAYIF